jgi:hypothetical protein
MHSSVNYSGFVDLVPRRAQEGAGRDRLNGRGRPSLVAPAGRSKPATPLSDPVKIHTSNRE